MLSFTLELMMIWWNFSKKLILVSILFGIILAWWQGRKVLEENEEVLARSIEARLNESLASVVKKRPPLWQVQDYDKEKLIELTAYNCDAVAELNPITIFIENGRFKKFLHRNSEDFPPFDFYMIKEGTVEISGEKIFFISIDGKSVETFPLKVIKRGEDFIKAISYYGRPLHGAYCRPSQIASIKRFNFGQLKSL